MLLSPRRMLPSREATLVFFFSQCVAQSSPGAYEIGSGSCGFHLALKETYPISQYEVRRNCIMQFAGSASKRDVGPASHAGHRKGTYRYLPHRLRHINFRRSSALSLLSAVSPDATSSSASSNPKHIVSICYQAESMPSSPIGLLWMSDVILPRLHLIRPV